MSPRTNEFLDDQWRVFHDTDGTAWRVRIEQGGGARSAVADAAPVAMLNFRALDSDQHIELAIAGDVGNWDLATYPEHTLRALLAEAQAHATQSSAD